MSSASTRNTVNAMKLLFRSSASQLKGGIHSLDSRCGKPRGRGVLGFLFTLLRPRLKMFGCGLVLILIGRFASLVTPFSTRFVVDEVVGRRNIHLLIPVLAIIAGGVLLQALASLCATQIVSKGAQSLISDLRIKVQRHILNASVSFFDQRSSGNLVSRIIADIDGIRNVLGTGLVELLGSITTSMCALVLLFRLSMQMSFVTVGLLLLFLWSVIARFRITQPLFKERSRRTADLAGRLTESIYGVRVVKGFNAEEIESAEFATRVQGLLSVVCRVITADSTMAVVSTALTGLAGTVLLYVGIRLVLDGKLSLGSYLAYQVLLSYVLWPLTVVVGTGSQFTEAIVGIERTMEVLSEPSEHSAKRRHVALPRLSGEIVFHDVTFSYSKGTPVLHGICFRVQPNESIALVGASGAGKSTVANLLCGFYAPEEGLITIDGIDLATVMLPSYRGQLGVVFQDSFLFEGTIRENIMFARPDYSEAEFRRACRQAYVDEFAERFHEGYETLIGERGVRLSGGQRQRITIARALLANPRILILDEATSNVDSESEKLIQQGLAILMERCTTLVIAHRLSTIRRVDQILVMEAGRIVERGCHSDLLGRGTRYRELCDNQLAL